MIINSNPKKLIKTDIAKSLDISRSSPYYQPIMPIKDKEMKKLIKSVLSKHFSYVIKELSWNLR